MIRSSYAVNNLLRPPCDETNRGHNASFLLARDETVSGTTTDTIGFIINVEENLSIRRLHGIYSRKTPQKSLITQVNGVRHVTILQSGSTPIEVFSEYVEFNENNQCQERELFLEYYSKLKIWDKLHPIIIVLCDHP